MWVNQFKLGRPGVETLFDINPTELTPTWGRVASTSYNLAGDRFDRVMRTMRPTVKLKQSIFPKTQLDLFVSLIPITDTFLAFLTRDDWLINLEPNIAPNTTTVQLQNSSMTKLSQVYALGGFGSTPTFGTITITGVWAYIDNYYGVPRGTGVNYWTGGSYVEATRTITLGTPLPNAGQVYVSYSYPGWLVAMPKLDTSVLGGQVDNFGYSFELEGI